MSVILKVELLATLDNIQSFFHSNESWTLQLIDGTSSDLQKLLKCFNGKAIFTPFFLPPFGMVPIKFDYYLKDEELSVLTLKISLLFSFGCLSLLNCQKLREVSE